MLGIFLLIPCGLVRRLILRVRLPQGGPGQLRFLHRSSFHGCRSSGWCSIRMVSDTSSIRPGSWRPGTGNRFHHRAVERRESLPL